MFAIEALARYDHDNTPEEVEADKGWAIFKDFCNYVNTNYGANSFNENFNSTKSEDQKKQMLSYVILGVFKQRHSFGMGVIG